MNKPNVILILADDMGIGDLTCYNPVSKLETTNLGRLAAQGLRCNDAHASSALCTPSRYGLLTGRYNWRSSLKKIVIHGHGGHLIEDGRLTLGSLFKKAGYRTAVIGKWHLGMDWETISEPETFGQGPDVLESVKPEGLLLDHDKPVRNGPNDFGFDYCYVTPGSLDMPPYVFLENDRITERPNAITGTADFWPTKLSGTTKGIPYMSHWPLGPAAPCYDHQDVVPDSAERVLKLIDDYAESDDPFFLYYPLHAPHVPCLPTPEFEGKSSLGPYGDMVLMIDNIVGRIIDKLDEKGLEDTIIIFSSDNGGEQEFPDHLTSYIYRGFKSDIWEGGHRVPFIVRYPGVVAPGSVSDRVVSLTDMLATFSDMLGLPLSDNEGEDSISNLPIWRGEDRPVREATVYHSGMGMFAIRQGKWKLEMCPDNGGFTRPGAEPLPSDAPGIQLYDMENDVGETTNLCDKFPDVVSELTTKLTGYVLNGRSTPGLPQSNTGPAWWPELNWITEP